MTVAETITAAGITPSASYAGVETADDFILAIQTEASQTKESNWIVCADHIKGHPGSLNPETTDSAFIRTGKSSVKTGNQRTISIEGERVIGDAFQDFILSHKIKYGIGSDVVVPYVYFSIRTGKGEKGKAAILVTEDVSGNANEPAGLKVDLKAQGTPAEYTYSAS